MKNILEKCYCWHDEEASLKENGFTEKAINRLDRNYRGLGFTLYSIRILPSGGIIVGFYDDECLNYELYSGKSMRLCRLKKNRYTAI